jgi:hypothetical protein
LSEPTEELSPHHVYRRVHSGQWNSRKRKASSQAFINGETVDEWIEKGWGVLKVPIAAFTERGYTFDEPDEDGHLNAFGDHSLYAMDLAEQAAVVLPEISR